MPLKIRIQQTEKGFTGYLSNKVYKAPTRQGVIDLAMSEWLTVEDLPKPDLDPIMKHLRYIIEQCPTSSLFDLFCYERDRWDFEGWHDNDAFLKFIEDQHAIEYYKETPEHDHEDLVTVLMALGVRDHASFEVLAHVPDQDDSYWILRMEELFYYIASIHHIDYNDDNDDDVYYERVMKGASVVLSAVAHAPLLNQYNNAPIAVNTNLAYQVLGRQGIGVVDHTLTGYEK